MADPIEKRIDRAIRTIPELQETGANLRRFIKSLRNAVKTYNIDTEERLERFLDSLMPKYDDEIFEIISNNKVTTLEQLEAKLTAQFDNPRTHHQIAAAVGTIHQKDNETLIAYANRLKGILEEYTEAAAILPEEARTPAITQFTTNIEDKFQ